MRKIRAKYILSFVISCTFFWGILEANDPEFSQFYANKIYLNPAFAGASETAGLQLSFREQRFYSFPFTRNINISFDQFVYPIKGGVGFQFLNYKEGILNRMYLSGIYSYSLQLTNETFIRAGIQASIIQKKVLSSELILPNQIDFFSTSGQVNTLIADSKSGLIYDFSTGIVGNSKNSYYGIAVHHLTQPNENKNMSDTIMKIKRKYTLHFGTHINIFKRGLLHEKYIISPNILYQYQYSHRINYGLYGTYQNISAGVWIRQDLRFSFDAIIFLIGWSLENLDISYSYDFGMPKTGVFINMSTHEVTLKLKIQYKQKEKIEAIKCPKF